jgi:succinate dehydrogenase/fumarate reductase flavoprotein subunit
MELSRRSFLTSAVTTAAVAGVAGVAANAAVAPTQAQAKAPVRSSEDWLGEAPQIDEASIVETRECELLIVGAGNGGMAAAASAAELGMDFIVAEKGSSVGSTRHWLGAVNSKYADAAGVSDDKGKLLNELARYASGKCDQRVWKVWIDESASMIDWLDEILTTAGMTCVFDSDNQDPTGGTYYYIPYTEHYYSGKDAEGNTLVRNQVFESYINSLGYAVDYDTTLVKLEREDAGRVTGGIFELEDGSYARINASQGVLLATGGYPANPAMCQALAPIIERVVTLSYYNVLDTGDGIKAAMWIGAQKDEDPAPMLFNRGLVKPGESAGYVSTEGTGTFAGVGKQYNIGSQPFMKVARDGRRYCNESAPYDFDLNAVAEKPGGVFCQVFDSNAYEDIMRFNTIGCSRQIQQQLTAHEGTLEEFFADKIEEGTMQMADTLDELADKLGFEGEAKEAFLAQAEKCNEMYDAQEDDEFGKEAYRLSALRQPPYFGAWYGASFLTTVDGLRIDENMRVLDTDDQVISGLFAAGDCSGSLFANNYPEYVVACACGRTVTFGRHVARYVAEQAGYDLANVTAGDPTFKAEADEASDADVAAGPAADGTYTAEGKGIGGKFEVTVTVEGGAITAVEVGENSETQGIGSKAIEQLPELIVAANGTDGVDGVSGASVTSSAIFSAVEDCLAQARA